MAPELADGAAPTPASDQFALAAIAYEWLFGRPIDRPADRPVEVRTMPGVDRATLSNAFTRALSPRPSDRFGSCTAFCDALSAAVVPELPLLAAEAADDHDLESAGAFAEPADMASSDMSLRAPERDEFADKSLQVRDSATWSPDPGSRIPDPAVTSWNPAAAATPVESSASQKFGGMALILASLVGAVFGFAAGYMAKPRALQFTPPQTLATAPARTDQSIPAPVAPPAPVRVEEPAIQTTPSPKAPPAVKTTPPRTTASSRPGTAAKVERPVAGSGTLAVESRPVGASVRINGRARGKTPMLLTDLEPGEYRVVMSMPGFRDFATTVRVVAGERVRAAASLTAQEHE